MKSRHNIRQNRMIPNVTSGALLRACVLMAVLISAAALVCGTGSAGQLYTSTNPADGAFDASSTPMQSAVDNATAGELIYVYNASSDVWNVVENRSFCGDVIDDGEAYGTACAETTHSSRDVIRKKLFFEYPVVGKGIDEYDIIKIPDLEIYGNPGMPVLPLKTIKILLPPEGDVTYLNVEPSQEIKLEGSYLIEPGQVPVPISQEEKAKFTPPNKTIYKSDDPCPKDLYHIASIQELRGYRILILNIYPVRYYPMSGNVSFFPEIVVTVKTSENAVKALSNSGTKVENYRNLEKDKKRVASLVDNPKTLEEYSNIKNIESETPSVSGLLDTSYDYVIITNNALEPAFQRLADWKNSKGVNSTVVTVEDISNDPAYNGMDLQEEIRNFIKDAYANWGIEYVLLGGDGDCADVGYESGDNIIPARRFWAMDCDGDDGDLIPADMYYSNLDGTFDYDNDGIYGEPGDGEYGGEVDLYSEVFIGRAPVDSVEEVSNFVNKTIAYENLSGSEPYLKKTLMVGEHLGFGGEGDWGGNAKDEIKNYIAAPWTSSALYDRDYTGNKWPKSEIITRIDQGQHIINHLGHSSTLYVMKLCNAPVYQSGISCGTSGNTDVDDLTNDKYPLIYSQGCYPGAFDNWNYEGMYTKSDSIAEHFVTSEHGAFAVIMNSRYGWGSSIPSEGPSQYFDREFFDALSNENIRNLGKALQDSKEDNAGLVASSSYMRWCYYEINLLGDPETSIHEPLPEPHDISLTHSDAPTSIKLNEIAIINVTVNNIGQNDENNIEIRFLVDGIIEDTQVLPTLNSGSSQKLNFSWSTEVEGSYNMTIYAVPVAGEVVTSNNIVQTDISVVSAEILLVDDDEGSNYETYYSSALGYYYPHAIWNVSTQGSPSASDLQDYKIVIWLTGVDYSTTLTATDQANLQTFLDGGGKLFVSGQDIGFDIGDTSFYQNYLHANYTQDNTGIYNLTGVSGDPITDFINISIAGGDGANNQNYPSEISPYDSYATPIFYYDGDGIGALRVDTGTYRAVYFAFGFEAINDQWDRAYLMYRIINWLDVEPPVIYVSDHGATYVPAGNPVTINANVYDQSNIYSVYADIESPDENVIATIQLFDDGMHYDGSADDGVYGNSWTTHPEEKDYYIDFIANDTWGNSGKYNNTDRFTTVPFSITSDILLVDDSTYTSHINYYEDALNLNGYSCNLWDSDLRGEIDSSTIDSFELCIWSSPYSGPSSNEQSVLCDFLDNGGRLFISGQDIGYFIGETSFYQNYLHANYTQDDVNLYSLDGVYGDPITGGINISIVGGDGANNQWYPSEIDPFAPAESIFYYDAASSMSQENLTLSELPTISKENLGKTLEYNTTGISSSGTGALRVDTGTYRAVYFAFGFEAINDQLDRGYLMYRIINWLDIEPPSVWISDYGATYAPAGNPVTINANVYDQSNISSVYAEIESPDESVITTIQLFDDGMHYDGSADDGVYGNSWTTHPEEKDYYIDFVADDIWGNSAKYNNTDRFTTVPFSITSDILLVDDSTYTSHIHYYGDALNLNGYSYNLWDPDLRGEIDSSTINSFELCIWSSPYSGPGLTEQSVLCNFLDNGGRLFISGQDIGYSIGGTSFYQNYLHANYAQDDVDLYALYGVSGDPVGDGLTIGISGGDGVDNQQYPSEITPNGTDASMVFNYTGDSCGAVKADTGTYKVVYFAFGFEAINTSSDRNTVMDRVITWLEISSPGPPSITNITNTTPTSDSVTITWTTDKASDSLVKYGTESGNYTDSKSNATLVTTHSITLTGLNSDTTYYFMVNSTDASGNSNESEEHHFTTISAAPPVINAASINVSNQIDTSVIISWVTDAVSNSTVRVYDDSAGANLVDTFTDATTDDLHRVVCLGLPYPWTQYWYEVESTNTGGTTVDNNSGNYHTFKTAKGVGSAGTNVRLYVKNENGTPARNGVLVYFEVTHGGVTSWLLSGITIDGAGYAVVNLGNLKNPSTGDPLSYEVGDAIHAEAWAGAAGYGEIDTTIPPDYWLDNITLTEEVTKQIPLTMGWNLITMPLNATTPYTAKTLCTAIGANCTSVARWTATGWEAFECAEPFGGEWSINNGEGYFVRVSSDTIFKVSGTDFTTPIGLDMSMGWNLIGIPCSVTSYTAKTLCTAIGANCTSVARWTATGWEAFECAEPFGGEWSIEKDQGYFVRVGADTYWTST